MVEPTPFPKKPKSPPEPVISMSSAIRQLRRWAHQNDLALVGPCYLRGMEFSGFGKSDQPQYFHSVHGLASADLLFPTLYLTAEDKGYLSAIADALLEESEFRIDQDGFPSIREEVPFQPDERDRWPITNGKGMHVATVVRTGEGASKHYLLFTRYESGFVLQDGEPWFDVPLFGIEDLMERPELPIMVHEGPKSRDGVKSLIDKRARGVEDLGGAKEKFVDWLSSFNHVAWHGSERGISWTDWSPLRGRNVVVWSDLDEQGIINARLIGKLLSELGNVVGYVDWDREAIDKRPGWDLADDFVGMGWLSRSSVRKRIRRIESPFNRRGQVMREWLNRSFIDRNKGEVYQLGYGYRPASKDAIRDQYGPKSWNRIVKEPLNEYMGSAFLPGLAMGKLPGGKINVCPPSLREPCDAAPLPREMWREIRNRWLRRMVPNWQQRKYLLQRAAMALVSPRTVPQSMVLLGGNSGSGKSVFMSTLVAVAGEDRAGTVMPDDIFGNFNAKVENRSIVCVHEIHGAEMNRKETSTRLKELIGNTTMSLHKKNRDQQDIESTIHWFAATNERVPVNLEAGNNRFFFVECIAGEDGSRDKMIRDKFFRNWRDMLFHDEELHDDLYAAAKWIYGGMTSLRRSMLLERPPAQARSREIEREGMAAWQQVAVGMLEEFEEDTKDVFFATQIVNLIRKDHKHVGPFTVLQFLKERGYRALRVDRGSEKQIVHRRTYGSRREVLWCREKDYGKFILDATRVGVEFLYHEKKPEEDE
jgi:energy-coupling factor transporter ATP-binding protein EcfA2